MPRREAYNYAHAELCTFGDKKANPGLPLYCMERVISGLPCLAESISGLSLGVGSLHNIAQLLGTESLSIVGTVHFKVLSKDSLESRGLGHCGVRVGFMEARRQKTCLSRRLNAAYSTSKV